MLVEMIVWSAKHGNAGVDAKFINRVEPDRAALLRDLQNRVGFLKFIVTNPENPSPYQ